MQHEPTLAEVIADLWRGRLWLLAGALAGFLAGLALIAVSVPQYRVSMLVGPAERGGGPDIKALLPENSSFAVQYLVNSMGAGQSNDFIRFEHILRGPTVAGVLAAEEAFSQGYAGARGFIFQPARKKPSQVSAVAAFLEDRVAVEPVGNTPLRRLVFLHPDRAFAAYLLARMHEIADGLIRQEIRDSTARREAYLRQALAGTAHPDHRRALTSLLMEQEHVRMILAMDEPFAAIIAEPAAAGDRPYWPRKTIIFPVFILGGMMLAVMLRSLREARPR